MTEASCESPLTPDEIRGVARMADALWPRARAISWLYGIASDLEFGRTPAATAHERSTSMVLALLREDWCVCREHRAACSVSCSAYSSKREPTLFAEQVLALGRALHAPTSVLLERINDGRRARGEPEMPAPKENS